MFYFSLKKKKNKANDVIKINCLLNGIFFGEKKQINNA